MTSSIPPASQRIPKFVLLFLACVALSVIWNVSSFLALHAFQSTASTLGFASTRAPASTLRRHADLGNELPACQIVIQNRVNFHYELLESLALRYPLPWERMGKNCNSSGSILVDYALTQKNNGRVFFDERRGWETYFERYLQNQHVERVVDGKRIVFRRLVHWDAANDYQYDIDYDAVIEATCDYGLIEDGLDYRQWLLADPQKHYCILHALATRKIGPKIENQTCWLNPMHAPNCFFLPVDLPKFPNLGWAIAITSTATDISSIDAPISENEDKMTDSSNSINLCLLGSKTRHHELLVETLAKLQPTDVQVVIYAQPNKKLPFLPRYESKRISTRIVQENLFRDFQKSIATTCHVFLPLLDPALHPDYFPTGELKRLAGSIVQIIGNSIPSILHQELHDVYRDYLNSPTSTYHDSATFQTALGKMLTEIRQGRANNNNK